MVVTDCEVNSLRKRYDRPSGNEVRRETLGGPLPTLASECKKEVIFFDNRALSILSQ